MDPQFKEIAKLLTKLPGIGPRQAARITLALLDKPQAELTELGQAIVELKDRIRICSECFNISDDGICAICRDSHRQAKTIMVLEKVTDLESVERSGLYKGLYHVLGGAIDPVQGTGPGGNPPMQSLLDWIRVKRIEPRSPGMDLHDLAFVIGRSIREKGTRPHPFAAPTHQRMQDRVVELVRLSAIDGLREVGLQ